MGLQIEDGKGKGYIAEVDEYNRLATLAVTETELISESEDGNAYSWSNISYDYAAADTILLVRSDSPTAVLHIDHIYLHGSTATEVVIHSPTATFTPAGTAVTGVNLNRTSGKVALATAKANETGNVQGAVLWRGAIAGAGVDSVMIDIGSAIVLGNEQSIGVDYVTDGTAARVTIIGHYATIS